ncbi:MAG TPA: hypothetical protein VIV40_42255 [Kofleriaceae bacterium]
MRWSAVFAGTALAIGLWILLQTLGMGIGLAAVDTDDAGSLKGAGIGTGIWSIIAPLIAMFVGAYVVGRLSGTRDPKVGAMHGSVMWALATAIGLWMMLSIVSALASGAARIGGTAVDATGSIVGGAASAGGYADNAASALGIDTNDLLAPINQRLQQQGKPTITARELNATIRAVAHRGIRQGKLDREVLVEELARNTSLSRADAEDIANQFAARYEEAANRIRTRVDQLGQDAKHAALEAADKTGKALFAGGIMMLLSLASAIGGGILGVRGQRDPRAPSSREPVRTVEPPIVSTTTYPTEP